MQLVNMDVDRHGTGDRCRLGNFSPGLNAISGPRGSGKTALLAWLRQLSGSLLNPPISSAGGSPVSGSLQFRNNGQAYRLTNDRVGRTACEEFDVGPTASGYSGRRSPSPLTRLQCQVLASLLAASGTADTESALQTLAEQLRLTETDYQPLSTEAEQLLVRRRELEKQLERFLPIQPSAEILLERRAKLQRELVSAEEAVRERDSRLARQREQEEQRQRIENELDAVTRLIDELDEQLTKRCDELSRVEVAVPGPSEASDRQRLQCIDEQLARWRQTLSDMQSHRERIEKEVVENRLAVQVGNQLADSNNDDPRAIVRSLEAQILAAQKQLDGLAEHNGQTISTAPLSSTAYRVYTDEFGNTRISYSPRQPQFVDRQELPAVLRQMQRELYELCQQIDRHESRSANENLHLQSQQLRRCEQELQSSIEKLISERAGLLQHIAEKYNLATERIALTNSESCQCREHPRLEEWLRRDEVPATVESRTSSRLAWMEEIDAMQRQRDAASERAGACRSQLKTLSDQEVTGPGQSNVCELSVRDPAVIRADLNSLAEQLATLERRDLLARELQQIRAQLSDFPAASSVSGFLQATNRHIAGLMAGVREHYERAGGSSNGELEGYTVPNPLVRIAMRLVIADAVAEREQRIPVFLDETLDALPPEIQQSAMNHLAEVASRGQQLFVLTSDEQIAEMVRGHTGWVGYMQAAPAIRSSLDVNRHLAALANDLEADEWCPTPTRPEGVRRGVPRGDYYLNERSLIEDAPSIDPTSAARCRALGVDRVGDLLNVDPPWLAVHMKLDGIDGGHVTAWQAEARLLCGVPRLRPFDARLLVGSGVTSPQQLAKMHPSKLLKRVERFLTTKQGRYILRSGSSFELSRVTTWIASAKGGSRQYYESSIDDRPPIDDRGVSTERDQQSTSRQPSSASTGRANGKRSRRAASASKHRPQGQAYAVVGGSREKSSKLETRETARPGRALRYYLELASPIVDAPSIGSRMAARLEPFGISTVSQLLAANPAELAQQLDLRRVETSTVQAWQAQARLMCRVPNLRGHDVQLLVACGLTSPEELAGMEAAELLAQVQEIARSPRGELILRGSPEPEIDEVSSWLEWVGHCRSLNAA